MAKKREPEENGWSRWTTRAWGVVVPLVCVVLLFQDQADNGRLDNGPILFGVLLFFAGGQAAYEAWERIRGGGGK